MDNTQSPQSRNQNPQVKAAPKQSLVWLGIALVIALAIGTAMLLMSMNADNEPENIATGEVLLNGTTIEPDTIAIKRGQSVTWKNQGQAAYQLVSDNLPDFSTTEPLTPGESFSYTFDDPGTFHYYDFNDPTKIKGTVNVE